MDTVRLLRVTYKTDIDDNEPEYRGSWSDPFPKPGKDGRQVVGVDWSVRGEVTVTFMVPWRS